MNCIGERRLRSCCRRRRFTGLVRYRRCRRRRRLCKKKGGGIRAGLGIPAGPDGAREVERKAWCGDPGPDDASLGGPGRRRLIRRGLRTRSRRGESLNFFNSGGQISDLLEDRRRCRNFFSLSQPFFFASRSGRLFAALFDQRRFFRPRRS